MWPGARLLARAAVAAAAAALLVVPVATAGAAGRGRDAHATAARRPAQQVDWSTYGFDVQRTGDNPDETTIGVGNVGGLHVAWSANLGAVMIAQPVEAVDVAIGQSTKNVIYIGTEHGEFYAIDASNGQTLWHVNLGSVQTNCFDMPDAVFGIGGAGVIDRAANLVYVAGGDGKVHAFDLATGAEASGWPVAGVFAPATEHVYGGINEWNGKLYVVTASHCDISPYHGKVAQIDIATHAIQHTFYPAGKHVNGGGIWGPGGVSIDPVARRVFTATGNALTSPESYRYSEDVVEMTAGLKVKGSNYPGLQGGDVDFGATPLLYQVPGCPPQVVAKNKSGVLVQYKRGHLSAGYTQRLQIADVNDYEFNGIPAFSPVTNLVYIGNSSDSNTGTYLHGMIALKTGSNCRLSLAWQDTVGPNYDSMSPPTVANGVVYYGDGGGNTEYAFDAATGAPLWNSASIITGRLVAAPAVVNGQVLVPSWDDHLYAFVP
jgi:outer membrane protein assembly factor BamB